MALSGRAFLRVVEEAALRPVADHAGARLVAPGGGVCDHVVDRARLGDELHAMEITPNRSTLRFRVKRGLADTGFGRAIRLDPGTAAGACGPAARAREEVVPVDIRKLLLFV